MGGICREILSLHNEGRILLRPPSQRLLWYSRSVMPFALSLLRPPLRFHIQILSASMAMPSLGLLTTRERIRNSPRFWSSDRFFHHQCNCTLVGVATGLRIVLPNLPYADGQSSFWGVAYTLSVQSDFLFKTCSHSSKPHSIEPIPQPVALAPRWISICITHIFPLHPFALSFASMSWAIQQPLPLHFLNIPLPNPIGFRMFQPLQLPRVNAAVHMGPLPPRAIPRPGFC